MSPPNKLTYTASGFVYLNGGVIGDLRTTDCEPWDIKNEAIQTIKELARKLNIPCEKVN